LIQFGKSGEALHLFHVDWLSRKIGCGRGWKPDNTVSMGWYRGAALKAVVVYHDWSPEYQSIAMSAASEDKRWLTRETLYRMHQYPFEDANCRIAVLQVSENNSVMLGIARRFGYEMTRVPRFRGPDEAEIICILDREKWANCRATTTYLARQARLG